MLPKVTIYNLVSLDGRIDRFTEKDAEVGLYYQLSGRWKADATLAGSETIFLLGGHEAEEEAVEEPDPPKKLPPPGTEDLIYEPRPLLVVPDSRGRIHNWRVLQQEPWWRKIIVLCSESTPESYLDYLAKRHIEHLVVGEDRVDLRAALEELSLRYGARTVRTDGGGSLNAALLRGGLADEVYLLISPSIVGGSPGPTLVRDPGPKGAFGSIRLRLAKMEEVGADAVLLCYDVVRP